MAGRKSTKLIKKKVPQEIDAKFPFDTDLLARLKLEESYTSLLLGATVVVIGAIVVVSVLKGKNMLFSKFAHQQTSSAKTEQSTKQNKEVSGVQTQQDSSGKITGTRYVVQDGDLLWDIAVRAYGDGFKWQDIAKENNLTNPDVLVAGTILKIPR